MRRVLFAVFLGSMVTVAASNSLAQSASPRKSESSRWQLEAAVVVTAPTSEAFSQGWGAGYGLFGSLRRGFGSRLQVGLEGDFAQFGFTGLEGFGTLGGARREFGVAVPLHVLVWERRSHGREQISLVGSAGWGWQQVEGTFGSTVDSDVSVPMNGDGFRASGEVRFSRILYRTTRWNAGVRFTSVDLVDETPQYVSIMLGAQMPLSGSRPR